MVDLSVLWTSLMGILASVFLWVQEFVSALF